MNDKRFPTRIVETGRVVRGSSGQGVGWLQSLAARARNLRAQLTGVNMRLQSPFENGVPACVPGSFTFKADTSTTFTANGVSVNPIVSAGQTYRIPINFPPPGVFMAHNLIVTIDVGNPAFRAASTTAGIDFGITSFPPRPWIEPINDYRQARIQIDPNSPLFGNDLSLESGGMIAEAAPLRYTNQQQILKSVYSNPEVAGFDDFVLPFLPFFWNIVDEKSGRQYAPDLIPHGVLLNSRGRDSSVREAPDGEFFEFDTPWLFERDAAVSFLFRPIMDLYQPANSAVTSNQQATVNIEFHGNRYYDRQDVLKEGALV